MPVGKRDPYRGIKHQKQMADVFNRKSGEHTSKKIYNRAKEKEAERESEKAMFELCEQELGDFLEGV